MNKLNSLLKRSGSYDVNKPKSEDTAPKKGLFKSKRSVSLCTLTSYKSLPSSTPEKVRKSVSFSGPFPTHHRPLSLTNAPSTSGTSGTKLSERKSANLASPQKTLPSPLQSAKEPKVDLQKALNSSWDSGERKFDLTNLAQQVSLSDLPHVVVSKSTMASDFMITVDNTVYTASSTSNLLGLAQLAHPDCPLSKQEKQTVLAEATVHKTLPTPLPTPLPQNITDAMTSSWNSTESKFDLVTLGQELPIADLPTAVTSEGNTHSDFMLQIGSTIYTPSSKENLLELAVFAHPECPQNSTEKRKNLEKATVHKTILPELTSALKEKYQNILNSAWDNNTKTWDLASIAEHVTAAEMPGILMQSNGLHSEFTFNIAGEIYKPSSMHNLLDLAQIVHPDSVVTNLDTDKAIRWATRMKQK